MERSGTPVDERHTRLIAPFGGDRLFVNGLLPPRWGLDVCAQLLQGLHSALPRYTPAYALNAPNGAFFQPLDVKLPIEFSHAVKVD